MSPFYKLKVWLGIAKEEKELTLKEKMLADFVYKERTDKEYEDDWLRCQQEFKTDDEIRYENTINNKIWEW